MSGAKPVEPAMKAHGKGTFTPPPAPCGNWRCAYVGFDVVHDETCEED